jgi:hypothetical protein
MGKNKTKATFNGKMTSFNLLMGKYLMIKILRKNIKKILYNLSIVS